MLEGVVGLELYSVDMEIMYRDVCVITIWMDVV